MRARRIGHVLTIALVAGAALTAAGQAATYTVGSILDTAGTCSPSPASCTLRQAITTANMSAGTADVINFSVSGTISPTPAMLPAVTDSVTIDGSGQQIRIDGASAGPFDDGLRFAGGTSTVSGLSVTRAAIAGIEVRSGASVTIQGCRLGVDFSDVALGNGDGVNVSTDAASATIGGTNPGDGNVISGNGADGIAIAGSAPTVAIYGNRIGTNAAGTVAVSGQPNGVVLHGPGHVVGGPGAGQGNQIAGNTISGVFISDAGADGNSVEGNTIGLAADGVTPLGNTDGVLLGPDASGNRVGGTTTGQGNRIAGNTSNVSIAGDSSVVQGNIIGLTQSGGASGSVIGVNVAQGADGTVIGGNTDAARNVLSGNGAGIQTDGTHTKVLGNYIGLAPNGVDLASNTTSGVIVQQGADNSEIGGPGAGEGNLISGNNAAGIVIRNSPSGVLVRGNGIGVNKDGAAARNITAGIRIFDAANNTIGGPGAADANTIAFSGGQGIDIDRNDPTNPNFEEPVGNQVMRNSIHDNGGFGIDLSLTLILGRTPNDAGDADTGPNLLQNFPVLATAYNSGASTTVSGSLGSAPGATYKLRFWSNPAGGDEAETYLGDQDVTTDGGGNVSFTFTPAGPVDLGRTITATATDASGNSSELSDPVTVQTPPAPTVDAHTGVLGFRAASFKATSTYITFKVTNRVDFDFKIKVTGRDGKVGRAHPPAFKSVSTTIKAGKTKTIKLKIPSSQRKVITRELKKHSRVTRRPSIRVANVTTGASRQYKPRVTVKR